MVSGFSEQEKEQERERDLFAGRSLIQLIPLDYSPTSSRKKGWDKRVKERCKLAFFGAAPLDTGGP